VFDRLAPWPDQVPWNGATMEGPISHYLGGLATVLGRYHEPDGLFAHAAVFRDQMGRDSFTARTGLSWGRMLRKRRGEKAPGLLDVSWSTARPLWIRPSTVSSPWPTVCRASC